jgi:hypothetical protein
MSYFYAHLVNPDDITKHMELLEMTDAERNHLLMIVQSTLHHKVIDLILEELHDDHKHVFLKHIVEENHDGVWDLLLRHLQLSYVKT